MSILLGHSIFLLLGLIFLSVPFPKMGSLNISLVVEVCIIGHAYFYFRHFRTQYSEKSNKQQAF